MMKSPPSNGTTEKAATSAHAAAGPDIVRAIPGVGDAFGIARKAVAQHEELKVQLRSEDGLCIQHDRLRGIDAAGKRQGVNRCEKNAKVFYSAAC
jgi:hypothetical protein